MYCQFSELNLVDKCVGKCEVCVQEKLLRSHPKKCMRKATRPVETIHSDVAGKIKPDSKGGAKFIMTFIDEFSRYCTVFCIERKKSQVFECFKTFQVAVESSHKVKIDIFQTDNGGEYMSKEFEELFAKCGITHRKRAS